MGPNVTINPRTGLISGVAPAVPGQYVLCVCVGEYRNGILIGRTRKELHVEVGDCSPLKAQLNPRPAFCKSGLQVDFQNDAAGNPAGSEYLWDFGDPSTGILNNATTATASHTFSAAGTYSVKLRVSMAGTCTDSSVTTIRVYPGFYPGFTSTGNCFLNPFQFTDTTHANYGNVSSWSWNFGDASTLADTSHLNTPNWTYPSGGPRTVTLIVGSDVGCVDTIQKLISIDDKPALTLGFRDTLICQYDTLTLNASGVGLINWTPPTNIIGANTGNPRVFPMTTTWYYAHLTNSGCTNTDSVRVRVTDGVYITPMNDTTICKGDTARLRIESNGLQFNWTPAATLNDPSLMIPTASVKNTTTYSVTGTIGGCTATKQIKVTTVPYPISLLGTDGTICYGRSFLMQATINGSSFFWTPSSYLSNPRILNPVASPPDTQRYILTVYDTLGCPKPGLDTIMVNVLPEVIAFAGRDTTVVINQPLQFNASGGLTYNWSPATGLSSTIIPNPIGVYSLGTDSVRYRLIAKDANNCPDTAYMTVRIFRTPPSIFVPSAFTPNHDGLNDVFKPIYAGIQKINYFRIFNRWGQLVYQTTIDGAAWDGKLNGQIQTTNVYVWTVSAIDYLGNSYFNKGTVTLIR
jgi:gliding motility-associated-like protein